jgi:hypothetical protein
MSRGRNPYRRAGSWISGTGWAVEPDVPVDGQNDALPASATAVDQLRHGYRLGDLHAIARLAVHVAGRLATNWYERYDTAWSGIVEHLYAATDPPTRQDLVSAGRLSIYAVVDGDRQTHGYYRRKTIGAAAGPYSSPAYRMYWLDWLANVQHDHAPAVVEREAVPRILTALTQRQREALLALAAHEDYALAANAMGVRISSFTSYISEARIRFFRLWHEGETPGPRWIDRRVASHTSTAATRTSLAERMSARRTRLRRTTQ